MGLPAGPRRGPGHPGLCRLSGPPRRPDAVLPAAARPFTLRLPAGARSWAASSPSASPRGPRAGPAPGSGTGACQGVQCWGPRGLSRPGRTRTQACPRPSRTPALPVRLGAWMAPLPRATVTRRLPRCHGDRCHRGCFSKDGPAPRIRNSLVPVLVPVLVRSQTSGARRPRASRRAGSRPSGNGPNRSPRPPGTASHWRQTDT